MVIEMMRNRFSSRTHLHRVGKSADLPALLRVCGVSQAFDVWARREDHDLRKAGFGPLKVRQFQGLQLSLFAQLHQFSNDLLDNSVWGGGS